MRPPFLQPHGWNSAHYAGTDPLARWTEAKKKFSRERIDVKIGSRVLGITEESISFKSKATGKLMEIPYGMIVWSTDQIRGPAPSQWHSAVKGPGRAVSPQGLLVVQGWVTV
uniref:Uncharacterized protein n=1 Tax=Physcomitrium patens TaxID=3218 RepID=A0A2K1JXK9_PHYPA|nr:hypothetical protein PHYPA_013385 [Physcomitrium patens]